MFYACCLSLRVSTSSSQQQQEQARQLLLQQQAQQQQQKVEDVKPIVDENGVKRQKPECKLQSFINLVIHGV